MTEVAVRERDLFAPIEAAALLPAGSLSMVGLDLRDPDMPFEDWQELGRRLGHAHRWSTWALGDWLVFGEEVYGETAYNATEGTTADRYDLAHRVTGLSHGTLANYASVCSRIARSRRRVELFFSTHEPVAALEPDEQTVWLQRAVDSAWTKDELRVAIRDAKNPPLESGDGGDGEAGRMVRSEQIEFAARLCWQQAQKTPDGVVVPRSAWAQLGAALGEE